MFPLVIEGDFEGLIDRADGASQNFSCYTPKVLLG